MSVFVPPTLGAYWPLFILAERGEEGCAGVGLRDALYPQTPGDMRRVFTPIFERVCPAAEVGLLLAEDAELELWLRVLRHAQLTGARDELTLMPSWLTCDGVFLTGLARVLHLLPFERLDVFMAAMAGKGAA